MKLIQYFVTKNPCYKNNINKIDNRYILFQQRGPQGGMLHSVGCAQSSALVFIESHWNKATQNSVCVHGVIDAETGWAYQNLPWNYRGWHGGGSCNNTHIGVEMCESKHIRYLLPGDAGYSPGKFVILDKAKAQADCKRTYDTAVELFAMLADTYGWDPDKDIISHKEGNKLGIATPHADPEHYWAGLGMPYTMDGFRSDVKKQIAKLNAVEEPAPDPVATVFNSIGSYLSNIETSVSAIKKSIDILQTYLKETDDGEV